MAKIVRLFSTIIVVYENGNVINKSLQTEPEAIEIFNKLNNDLSECEIINILFPEVKTVNNISSIENSKLLSKRGDSIYWNEISQLSIPQQFVNKILEAENSDDEVLIDTYRNFWTLMCLNPDSRCRQNLFWFLEKYGMRISRSGLFVGYRNVDYKESESIEFTFVKNLYNKVKYSWKKAPRNFTISPDKRVIRKTFEDKYSLEDYYNAVIAKGTTILNDIYTDHHSHTFTIKLGELVTMPRKDCDDCQENTCSKGLHVGGLGWLKQHYFGDTGIMVLVNPADVVAVPPYDDYGKLRTCAYMPVCEISYDENGNVIEKELKDGFECKFINEVVKATKNVTDEKDDIYKISIPVIPELNVDVINNLILKNAKNFNKQMN